MSEPARSIQADNGVLNIQVWPSEGRRPLLLVHGMAGNTHWWDQTAPLLSRDFAPAAVDLSGHGQSAWRKDGLYSDAGFVENIEQARIALGWEEFFLCGHSFGARMSLEYALKYPRRLQGLVCVDFMPEYRPANPKKRGFLARHKPRQPIYKDKAQMIERFHLQPPPTTLDRNQIKALAEFCIRPVELGYTWNTDWSIFTFQYESAWPVFPKLSVPCLIIRGEFSSIMERADFDAAIKSTPGGQGFEIPGSFHHVPLDTPRELAAALSKFVLGREAGDRSS